MAIRVCVAGATGWAGAAITRQILASTDFVLAGAVARQQAGSDIGAALGLPHSGIRIAGTVTEALQAPTDVLIDYTRPDAVKAHTLAALAAGVRSSSARRGSRRPTTLRLTRRLKSETWVSSRRGTSRSPPRWRSTLP